MNIDELGLAIRIAHEARISIFITGVQGLGKSASAKDYANNNFHFYEKDADGHVTGTNIPYGYVDLRCASMESSELRGLPDKDVERGVVKYLPPDELPCGEWINNKGDTFGVPGDPKPEDEDGIVWVQHKGILVLEEVNRAEDDIHQALFQLVYDHQIGKWHLPTGWSIVATGNPSGGNFIVNQFMHEDAFKDRFIHINISLDEEYTKGWTNYMHGLDYDDEIINKITQFCSMDIRNLSQSEMSESEEIKVTPSPRSWELVARAEMAYIKVKNLGLFDKSILSKVRNELLSGIIGSDLAAGYNECVVKVIPSQIAENFNSVKSVVAELERTQLQALSWGVSGYASKLSNINDEIANNLIAFGKWILKESSRENDDSRDLAVGYFNELLKSEQQEEIRELAFANRSLQKLLMKSDNSTYLYTKISNDKELNDLLYAGHRGSLDG